METIKIGSTGEDVRLPQMYLGVAVDGVFGQVTKSALMAYQASVGLQPDAICGQKTWAAITGGVTYPTKPQISYQTSTKLCKNKPGRSVKYIAIHYTAGSTSKAGSALATRNGWLKRNPINASADFVVDDKEIVQVNPDIRNNYCWSVGGDVYKGCGGASLYGVASNSNVIGIEICSSHKADTDIHKPNHDGWYFTDAAIDNAVRLVRYLMKEYNIPIERVIRHYDVNGKPCPGVVGWNDAPLYDKKTGKQLTTRNTSVKWEAFKKRLL